MMGMKWMKYGQRESCLEEIKALLPLVGRLVVNSEDVDLFALNFYLKDFVKRNNTTADTQGIPLAIQPREKRKMSPVCNFENAIKKLAAGPGIRYVLLL